MELPTKKIKAIDDNPHFFIIYGKQKSGKTTILSQLEDCLIIDLERGSKFVDALKVECNSFEELISIKTALEDKKKEKNGVNPYKIIALDTATALEDMVMPFAISLYKETSMGKNFKGDDLRKLPNGAGYLYMREAYKRVINGFLPVCDTLILVGHCSDRLINKDGKEISEMDLDLTGKLRRIISARADAVGYLYRSKNKTILNFKGGEDLIVEARPKHLRGKEIVIAESDEDNNITTHWDKIFI